MHIKKSIAPIILATLWIGLSEFVRNQVLFHGLWEKHYTSMGVVFPSKSINGAVWMIWSLVFAGCIYFLVNKLSQREVIVIAWTMGFMMMWLVIGNLGVLPMRLLWFAVPLSVLEVVVAVKICTRLNK